MVPLCIAAIGAVMLASAMPSGTEPLVGTASVVDGDTIEIHGTRIRLNGIHAPLHRRGASRALALLAGPLHAFERPCSHARQ
ncbi:hypothetical protein [Mesorhizobium sp.]|uniref:hypothetical protein n=1 Tax=Mesorhizobium sp. TaxID=1871066 RepID=UPI0025BB18B5|nr:hypothetical protein [Mesorhizobium sp.]